MRELDLNEMKKVSGGAVVVEEMPGDPNATKYWIVRQDGTVYAPSPSLEQAIECAKQLNLSQQVLTKEQYREMFGRDLVW